MKKRFYLLLILLLVFPCSIKANIVCNDGTISPSCGDCHRGCCSHHGGCSSNYSSGGSTGGSSGSTSTTRTVQRTYVQPKSSNKSIESITVNNQVISNVKYANSLTVRNHIASIFVALADSKATYVVNGDTNLKLDEPNVFNIVVTAEDGTTKTYILNITRKIAKSDVTLDLYINGTIVNFNGKNTYNTSKKFKNNKIKFKYETSDGLSDVKIYRGTKEINGTLKLKKGKNKFKIVLTDQNGDQNTYRVNITRKK